MIGRGYNNKICSHDSNHCCFLMSVCPCTSMSFLIHCMLASSYVQGSICVWEDYAPCMRCEPPGWWCGAWARWQSVSKVHDLAWSDLVCELEVVNEMRRMSPQSNGGCWQTWGWCDLYSRICLRPIMSSKRSGQNVAARSVSVQLEWYMVLCR